MAAGPARDTGFYRWLLPRLLGLMVPALAGLGFGGSAMANQVMPGHAWFDGTVEAAMAKAKSEGKPVLLYWGAVWCPPCNELKSQVFSQPRFAELVRPLVAVALDGDSEQAQAWGERLKVGGYPTVLLLDASGKELMRLATSVGIGEFEAALTAALATGHGFTAALEKAQHGQASTDDWRMLAYYNWDETADFTAGSAALLTIQRQLVANVPRPLVVERALLTAQLLVSCASAAAPTAAAPASSGKAAAGDLSLMTALVSCRREAPAQFTWLLENSMARQAARSLIIDSGPAILAWLYAQPTPDQARADALWLQATAELSHRPELSVDARLNAETASFQLYRLRHKGAKDHSEATPPELAAAVAASVKAADAAATTHYDRHSVISDAAGLLRDSGQAPAARALLDRELQHTDTPWYYQSAYARLEKDEGHPEAALAWMQKARESAQGRATRVQWIANDLAMTSDTQVSGQKQRLAALVRAFYEAALALPDGFQGRNASYAGLVARSLAPWQHDPELASIIAEYAAACPRSHAAGCQKHFAKLSAAPKSGAAL